jgi:hypothetical protein
MQDTGHGTSWGEEAAAVVHQRDPLKTSTTPQCLEPLQAIPSL